MSLTGTLSGALIRKRFIDYFQNKRGHLHLPSASLVPQNPTVLLTPAGMLPFVPIFLGIEAPPSPPRAVTSQKCARISGKASDLEYVGRTPRHHTFFEMLGNFSFGDYFKHQVIPWAWEFLTEEMGLSKERLWVTVFTTDFESRDIWRDAVGVPEERILFRDEKDNFWGPPGPTGPCGPCSEIHYDLQYDSANPPTREQVEELLDTERFIEIWNLVFMELFKDAEGNLTPLEKKNVDTGMGLERIAMVVQNKRNTFETDLFYPLLHQAARLSGIPYNQGAETDIALKIVADHVRCVTFALADGIVPSNEGRGYVIRMVLRRAVRYGKKYLGFNAPFLFKLVDTVRDMYQEAYPELKTHYKKVVDLIKTEEARFYETLDRGSRHLDDTIQKTKASGKSVIDGAEVFKLYDTYGFPIELTADIAREAGLSIDEEGCERAMEEQREKARGAQKTKAIVNDQVFGSILEQVGATQFVGYETMSQEATVKALIMNGESVQEVGNTNQPFLAILDTTPFYAESGGQVGDQGVFSREDGHHGLTVVVNDTKKVGELFVHSCLFDNGGVLRVGEKVIAQVEPVTRYQTMIHHTGTHLLQSALKKVLGDSVSQAGSQVTPEGARFDFTFHRAVTPDELQRAEFLMNKWIFDAAPATVRMMSIDEAKAAGAIAAFDEKYGDVVRVVSYGDVSSELCGGTHVSHLGQIGMAKIVSEGAIASGVRRIELAVGERAYKLFKQQETELLRTASLMKTSQRDVAARVEKLLDDLRQKDKAIQALEEKLAMQSVHQLLANVEDGPVPMLVQQLDNQSADALRMIGQSLMDSGKPGLVFLASAQDGKVSMVCFVQESLTKQGLSAGELVKQAALICDGKGGGRPNFAQAGAKNAEKLAEALSAVRKQVQSAQLPA